jgi:hypothetical protein
LTAPSKGAAHIPRFAVTPAKLTLEAADVDEVGLDLNDEQHACFRVERKDVDPSRTLACSDGNLPTHFPPRRGESTCDVRNASGMSSVSLPRAPKQDRCINAEYQGCPEGARDQVGLRNGEAGHISALDQRYVTLGAVDPTGQRALPHAEGDSDRSDLCAEVDAAL